MSGFLAWLTWLFVHLLFLIGFRNRIQVLWEWFWAYVTFQRGARLITGSSESIVPHASPEEDSPQFNAKGPEVQRKIG